MKKLIFLTVIILVCVTFIPKVFAFDSYVVHTKKPVMKVTTSDKSVVTANVLITIMNEKDTILVSPKGIGKATLTFYFKDEIVEIPVVVRKFKTSFKNSHSLEFVKLDPPPEIFQIDLPPSIKGNK